MAECVRLQPAPDDTPPPKPLFFDKRYQLPKHRIKLLERRHPHPRDPGLHFEEDPHIYTIFGKPTQLSVSGIAHDYQSHFDPFNAILLMKKSPKQAWPRLQYVHDARKIESVDEFVGPCLLYDPNTGETVASLDANCEEDGIVLYTVLDSMRVKPGVVANEEWYVHKGALSDSEIVNFWEANGENARNRGTEAHLQMELWLNSEPTRLDDGEVVVGLEFVRNCLAPIQAKAYRTEWAIFADEENVAGCIDAAFRMPDGSVFLVDWKRSEKLESKMYGYRQMRVPLNNLDDCDGSGYALQLSLYQYIIEKYYGLKVSGRALASIHPDKPFVTAVPHLKSEVEYLMGCCRAKTLARQDLRSKPEGRDFLCALSGDVVMTAVRDGEGRLYEKKNAILAGITWLQDDITTEEITKMIKERMPTVDKPKGSGKWKQIFKPTTDMLFYSGTSAQKQSTAC